MDRGFKKKYARYDLTHLKVSAEMAQGAAVAVAEFRDFLMERSIPNLVDKVMDNPMHGVGWMKIVIRWLILSSLVWRRQ